MSLKHKLPEVKQNKKKIRFKNKTSKKDIAVIKGEIELLSSLNHSHIVEYIDHKEKGGYLYIMMEYLETGSLAGSFFFKIFKSSISS